MAQKLTYAQKAQQHNKHNRHKHSGPQGIHVHLLCAFMYIYIHTYSMHVSIYIYSLCIARLQYINVYHESCVMYHMQSVCVCSNNCNIRVSYIYIYSHAHTCAYHIEHRDHRGMNSKDRNNNLLVLLQCAKGVPSIHSCT